MKAGTSDSGTERFGTERPGAERIYTERVGADFGAPTRHAALDEWRQRARAAERTGTLSRHPIATAVVVGAVCGLALAAWRGRQPSRRAPGRSTLRNSL